VPIKLHRCRHTWLHAKAEACWRVQKALDDMGVDYEVVRHPRSDRSEIERLTGQRLFPVVELEDGTAYREESKDMEARIRAGKLGKET
jgi:glutaredoxin